MRENGTVKDVFSHPDSGKVLGRDGSLMEAAEEMYGSRPSDRPRPLPDGVRAGNMAGAICDVTTVV